MTTPTWLWSVIALLFGINIGSFLNVVIWRLPRGGSLMDPQHSYCPSCNRRLTAIDLVPLFSFLFLGRRCRTCKQPISWRYFCVELLTGLLFMAMPYRFPNSAPDAVSLMLFTALLVPMTFIDLEFFQIPVSLNVLAFVLAVGRDLLGIAQHEASHAPLWGWLPRSLVGALAGILIFGGVRLVGWVWKRREAMGLGDVLLARAMGAMLVQVVPVGMPILRLFPVWVLFSCLSGLVVGGILLLSARGADVGSRSGEDEKVARERGKAPPAVEQEADGSEPYDDDAGTLKDQLKDIGYCLVFGDLIEYVGMKLRREREPNMTDDDYVPDPTAIPFGPYLALGFLATVFVGERLTAWYLAVALPKP